MKQADIDLQTSLLQEKVQIERQYKDYVINKLAQYIYHSHNVPCEISVSKSLQDIQTMGILIPQLPSTLEPYLIQQIDGVIGECKAMIDRYVQRKLLTAGSVLIQQHQHQNSKSSKSVLGKQSCTTLSQ